MTIRAKNVHCCCCDLRFAAWILCCVPLGVFFFGCQSCILTFWWTDAFGSRKGPLTGIWAFWYSDCLVSLKVLWRSQNLLIVMSTKKSWWWSRQRSLDGEVDKGGKELLSRSTKVHPSGSPGLWAELGLSGATLPPMMDATTPSHKSCLCPPWLHPSVKRWSNTPAHEISQILKTRPNTT